MILVVDFGAQYTQLIARRLRELCVFSEIVPYFHAGEKLAEAKRSGTLQGIILSGGPHSVYDKGAPHLDPLVLQQDVPVIGICYGLQLLNVHFGGRVEPAKVREYGLEKIRTKAGMRLPSPLQGIAETDADGDANTVWMSHGDEIVSLAPDLESIATTTNGTVAGFAHKTLPVFGLQFHPEVEHSRAGRLILRNFAVHVCKASQTWTSASVIETMTATVRKQADAHGKGSAVLCALSGGVDSCVAATLVKKAIGDRLHCIFIDNGVLRKNEFETVLHYLKDSLELNVKGVDASRLFLDRLRGVEDPEKKRKIIGNTFIEVFEKEAREIPNVKSLVQGTLYTDVIESVPVHGSSVVIKSHHNVGGLPEKMALKLIEPLRELFKDEVRLIGKELGIPSDILKRHPFPGPGLAIRILGEVTDERLAILRDADAILIEELKSTKLYDAVWQAFVVLLPVKSVGVMGDGRTYENTVAVRCVDASDGMTADWSQVPHAFLGRVSSRIVNECRGINRVVYDITSKPPATIEWE